MIEEASISDEKDPNALSDEIVKEVANGVFNKWKLAQSQVLNPPTPRTPSSRESILRGRDLFLGRTTEKLECAGCHGPLALGDGPSFVSQDVFNEVVFGGNPSEHARLASTSSPRRRRTLWNQKPDDWGNPLRPANLNRGVYKGGRRPIDIFWRIAKGINGAQMPAHYPCRSTRSKSGTWSTSCWLCLTSPSCSRTHRLPHVEPGGGLRQGWNQWRRCCSHARTVDRRPLTTIERERFRALLECPVWRWPPF